MDPIRFLLEQRTDPYIVDHNGWYVGLHNPIAELTDS